MHKCVDVWGVLRAGCEEHRMMKELGGFVTSNDECSFIHMLPVSCRKWLSIPTVLLTLNYILNRG